LDLLDKMLLQDCQSPSIAELTENGLTKCKNPYKIVLSCFRQHPYDPFKMLNYEQLVILTKEHKIPKFRADQLARAVYVERIDDIGKITTLPSELRNLFKEKIDVYSLVPESIRHSQDKKTTKIVFQTRDGKSLETVLMTYKDGRNTICVSCQIGCQMGCSFCATGKMGFLRNLTSEEITDQILFIENKILTSEQKVTNIVFMGMGEPLMNFENLVIALNNLNNPKTFNIGARSMTVSTCGIPDGIKKLADFGLQVNLAVSLHAPEQELREKLMPIAKKHDLQQLMEAISYYLEKTNRRVTYEYIMLHNINDSINHAKKLALLLKHQLCHINLIPYNAGSKSDLEKSKKENIEAFKKALSDKGLNVTVRMSFGDDINAACGQLANNK
jgi:23S rRNA (adenine2503-C2)-methyltransferase